MQVKLTFKIYKHYGSACLNVCIQVPAKKNSNIEVLLSFFSRKFRLLNLFHHIFSDMNTDEAKILYY